MKAVTYTRYSTEMQSDRSIEDQRRMCESAALKHGFAITRHYEDRAVSGTIALRRPGYQEMLAAAKQKAFDVLIVDDLSRLTRNMGEQGRLLDDFAFNGIRIIAVSDNIDTSVDGYEMSAGMRGIMNEQFIKKCAKETHRGLFGKAAKGMVAGGRVYGYKNIPVEHPTATDNYGRPLILDVKREVHPEQAGHVRQIFAWYAEGRSCMAIAAELNRMGLKSPHGHGWAASTIRVMLRNRLYIGEYIWNRQKKVRNKETGKRKYLAKPREQWSIRPMPELRIVDAAIWERVEARVIRAATSGRGKNGGGNYLENPKHLFSGFLRCACCGSNYVMASRDYYRCSGNNSKGTAICANNITVKREVVEYNLLKSIKHDLMDKRFFEAFRKEFIKKVKEPVKVDTTLPVRIAKLDKEIAEMVDTIRQGVRSPALLAALEAAEQEKVELLRQQKQSAMPPASVLDYVPVAVEQYRKLVEGLEDALHGDIFKARERIRGLIGSDIALHPREGYLEAEIPNGLMYHLAKAAGQQYDRYGAQNWAYQPSHYIPLLPKNKGGG